MVNGSNAGSLTGQLGGFATGAISNAIDNPVDTVNANLGSIGTGLVGQGLGLSFLSPPSLALGLVGRGIDSYRSSVQADDDLATMGVYGTGRDGKDLETSAWDAFFGNPAANQARDIANTYFADATDPNSDGDDTARGGDASVLGVTSESLNGFVSQAPTSRGPTATASNSFYGRDFDADKSSRAFEEMQSMISRNAANQARDKAEQEDKANRDAADAAADAAAGAYAADQAAMAAATDAANMASWSGYGYGPSGGKGSTSTYGGMQAGDMAAGGGAGGEGTGDGNDGGDWGWDW